MNKNHHQQRDGFEYRLLLCIKRMTERPFQKISMVKKGVWLLASPREQWVIKEFPSRKKLETQIDLTRDLFDHGFTHTYDFHPVGPIVFEGRIFGLIRYVKRSRDDPFHYGSARNRKDALALLSHFHETTEQFAGKYINDLALFQQLNKWEKRLADFQNQMHVFRKTSLYPYMEYYHRSGDWAIYFMKKHADYFLEEPHCILHGDVAHHNFLRKDDGSLYLIDFDLISIGPGQIDLIQFCNRILPEMDWSFDKLFSESEQLARFKNELPFLVALAYPADIFREWNHYVKSSRTEKARRKKYLEFITFEQYRKRTLFIQEIAAKVRRSL